jgi:hypothetical protein
VALAAAAYFFVNGNTLAAIKFLLAVLLVPGLVVFAVGGYLNTRPPHWYRSIGSVAAVMFLWGSALGLLPILLYMPWAPMRFPLDQMPFGFPIVIWIGFVVAMVGMALGIAWGSLTAWHNGERVRAIGRGILLVLIIYVGALIVTRGVPGG